MGRRLYQHPKVLRTRTQRPEWYIKVTKYALVPGQDKPIGKPERIYIGLCSEMTKHKADQERDRICAGINSIVTYVGAQIPFKEVARQFKAVKLPALSDNSQHNYTSIIDGKLIPEFGDERIGDIGPARVQAWANTLGGSRGAKKVHLAIFRSIWEAAEEWGYVSGRNPGKKIKVSGVSYIRKRRALDINECRSLIDACDSKCRLAAEVALACGARCGEILAMRFGDLDLDTGAWAIEANRSRNGIEGDPKTYSGRRTVYLEDIAREIAAAVPDGAASDHRIFALEYDEAHNALRRAAERAGIYWTGFGWHTLRRTYATLQDKAVRGDLKDLRERMGHASEKMTRHYVHRGEKREREIAGEIGKTVFAGQKPGTSKNERASNVIQFRKIQKDCA